MRRKYFNCRNREGQAALPFVLLVGGIVAEIVIAGAIVAFLLSSSSLGERLSVRALAAANTGVYDAVMRVANNKEFAVTSKNYSINVGDDSVTVDVSRSADDAKNLYSYTATSTATAGSRKKRVVSKFVVNQTNGEISIKSVEEVAAD